VCSVHIFIIFVTRKNLSKVTKKMDTEQNKDVFFMRAAISQAQEALHLGETPIGAVVVLADRIVGRGHNMVETLGDATAHAEMQALTAAMNTLGGKYLSECTLYVTVEPCAMCAGASAWSQIGRLVYGADEPKKGYTTLSAAILHPKTTVTKGVLEQECRTLMEDFFKKLRR